MNDTDERHSSIGHVAVPDGVIGSWRVETFTVSEEDSAMTRIRSWRPLEHVPAGTYKRLMHGRRVVMSNTPMEIRTNLPILTEARGAVVINGLGLGMVLTAILAKDSVHAVWVVEREAGVIALVAPTFADDARVRIVHADAFTWTPPAGLRFDAVWHDVWQDLCTDNLPEMTWLKRLYGQRAYWQGCWGESILRERARQDQRQRRG